MMLRMSEDFPPPESANWGIARRWYNSAGTSAGGGRAKKQTTSQLSESLLDGGAGDLVLLGPAGGGKSYELEVLATRLRSAGLVVRERRLAKIFEGNVEDGLDRLAAAAGPQGFVLLDALDEAMVGHERAKLALENWLESHRCSPTPPRLVITCRSAVWSESLTEVLRRFPPVEGASPEIRELLPIEWDEAQAAATRHGLDPDEFLDEVRRVRADGLIGLPITLQLLLEEFQEHRVLPGSRRVLFDRAIGRLVRESRDRTEDGTASRLQPAAAEEAAERLAVILLCSGAEAVTPVGSSSNGCLAAEHLSGVDREEKGLDLSDPDVLRRLAGTRLFQTRGQGSFGFVHRQFAEHLAGRRIASLMPHQAKSLLRGEVGVAGPLRETAAAAASADTTHAPVLARWIAQVDPEVIGLSEVADDRTRRIALLALLDEFRKGRIDSRGGFGRDAATAGLNHPEAAADLEAVLRQPLVGEGRLQDVAVDFVSGWGLSAADDALAELACNLATPLVLRRHAAYAVARIGGASSRGRLRVIVNEEEDVDRDLLGCALGACWPKQLNTKELVAALLRPTGESDIGFMSDFLHGLRCHPWALEEDLLKMLEWAVEMLRRREAEDDDEAVWLHRSRLDELMSSLCLAALGHGRRPSVRRALIKVFLTAAETSDEVLSKSGTRRPGSGTDAEAFGDCLRRDVSLRRQLLMELFEADPEEKELPVVLQISMRGVLQKEDLPWLFAEALNREPGDGRRAMALRTIRHLPWTEDPPCVERWLDARSATDVHEILNEPVFIELGGEAEKDARESWRWRCPVQERPVVPPGPALADQLQEAMQDSEASAGERVAKVLNALHVDDRRRGGGWWIGHGSPDAWPLLPDAVRDRVLDLLQERMHAYGDRVQLAEGFGFGVSTDDARRPALGLLISGRRDWTSQRPEVWWGGWAPYLLRTHQQLAEGDAGEPERWLLEELHRRVPDRVRQEIISALDDPGGRSMVEHILRILEPVEDETLDHALEERLQVRAVEEDAAPAVIRFLLRRVPDRSVPLLRDQLEASATPPAWRKLVAEGLFEERAAEAWVPLMAFCRDRPDEARTVVHHVTGERSVRRQPNLSLSFPQLGELVETLVRLFPPAEDPKRSSGVAFSPTYADQAATLRSALLRKMQEAGNEHAVAELQRLADVLGPEGCPGLRYTLAWAERDLRRIIWTPTPAADVLTLLGGVDRRLLCTPQDLLDATAAALEAYGERLQSGPQPEVEDLWNRAGAPRHPQRTRRDSRTRWQQRFVRISTGTVSMRTVRSRPADVRFPTLTLHLVTFQTFGWRPQRQQTCRCSPCRSK